MLFNKCRRAFDYQSRLCGRPFKTEDTLVRTQPDNAINGPDKPYGLLKERDRHFGRGAPLEEHGETEEHDSE